MSGFDWTYDIDAEMIHVGSKFRIDINTVINHRDNDILVENWSNGEFIEFEISWIGSNMDEDGRLFCRDAGEDVEVLMVVINDSKMPIHSIHQPGQTQFIEVSRVRELVDSGYWGHM